MTKNGMPKSNKVRKIYKKKLKIFRKQSLLVIPLIKQTNEKKYSLKITIK